MSPYELADRLNQTIAGQSSMKVGEIVKHPDGRMVKITSGQFLSNGRVSNFWYWKPLISPDGKLGKEECGYGW